MDSQWGAAFIGGKLEASYSPTTKVPEVDIPCHVDGKGAPLLETKVPSALETSQIRTVSRKSASSQPQYGWSSRRSMYHMSVSRL